jgi:hypothetical protein
VIDQVAKIIKPDGTAVKVQAYYDDMDDEIRRNDFKNINAAWNSLDCVIYINTVEAGIKVP